MWKKFGRSVVILLGIAACGLFLVLLAAWPNRLTMVQSTTLAPTPFTASTDPAVTSALIPHQSASPIPGLSSSKDVLIRDANLPLSPSTTLTLNSPGGAIQAVIYDGNELLTGASATTVLTGFGTVATGDVAKTSYIVFDGQCGAGAPNGCSGERTGGSGDTLSFTGGGGTLTNGPDAFKGSDGCPWGTDSCLWDTRNFNVSTQLRPGDSSVSATVTSGAGSDGSDCINHEAQVFARGPAAAWLNAGYVAAGKGLRNQSSGTINIAGIPSASKVVKAYLYWAILNSFNPGNAMRLNGTSTQGTLVKSGPDPCWDGGSWAFRADVTAVVQSNGSYVVSGYPTGNVSGLNPWSGDPSRTPMMEGASLIVFYEQGSNVDFSVDTVKLAQVVYDPDINGDNKTDLVLGKETVAQATILASGANPADTRTVKISAKLCGQIVDTATPVVGQIPQNGEVQLYFTPSSAGDCDVEIVVDPNDDISETNENNNTSKKAVDVKPTRAFNVGYFATNHCLFFGGCYGPLVELNETVTKSNEFIKATYPVATYSGTLSNSEYFGDPVKCLGVDDDILSIGVWGWLSGFEKSVGVVPQDYFNYHSVSLLPSCDLSGVVGITYCNYRGGLVTEGYWTTAAHEIGHMNGLACDQEEYNLDPVLGGNPASGFWVSRKTKVTDSVCFMGNAPLRSLNTRWVDIPDYIHLFKNFRNSPSDPTVVLVAALVHKDGTIDLRPWYFVPNGATADESIPGNYTVRVLDSTGQIRAEVTVPISFEMHVEPLGIKPTDTAPLLVAVPFGDMAATIQIVRDGEVLTSVSTTTKLLRDAIAAVPDFGFVMNPSQRRTALLNKIDAITQMLAVGNAKGAEQKLLNDVRPAIVSWLINDYKKTQPTQLEKNEVLAVVDAMILRVRNMVN